MIHEASDPERIAAAQARIRRSPQGQLAWSRLPLEKRMKLTDVRPFGQLEEPRIVAALVVLASKRIEALEARDEPHAPWGDGESREPCGCVDCTMVRVIWPTREDWQMAETVCRR